MEARLNGFDSSPLRHSAELLRIAFDSHRQNAISYRAAGSRISTGSAMITNGRAGIVFCAAALECAISTVVALLCMRAKPRIQRGLLMESVARSTNRDTIRALRMFFPDFRVFDKPELQELFTFRNEFSTRDPGTTKTTRDISLVPILHESSPSGRGRFQHQSQKLRLGLLNFRGTWVWGWKSLRL